MADTTIVCPMSTMPFVSCGLEKIFYQRILSPPDPNPSYAFAHMKKLYIQNICEMYSMYFTCIVDENLYN